MRLEDVTELESRELKEKVSTLSLNNKNFQSKLKGQKEQSKYLQYIIPGL